MLHGKLNILRKYSRWLLSAISALLIAAIYGALLPASVVCQGLPLPLPATSQNHSKPKSVFQIDPTRQGVIISWSGFSPDGKYYAYAENAEINVREAESGKLLRTFKGKPSEKYHNSWSVAFSPDSKLLASGSEGYALRVWDIESGKELSSFEGKAEGVSSVAFSPDGKLLASGGDDKSVRLWDVQSGREIKSFAGHDRTIRFIAFSPDSRRLASTTHYKSINLWDIESGKLLKSFDVDCYVSSINFLLNGKVLVSKKGDNTYRFLDIETGQEMKSLNDITKETHSMVFSPDSKLVAGIKFYEKAIRLWDIEIGKELQSFEPETNIGGRSMIFSPDSKVLAINSVKTIRFWDVKSGKILKSIVLKSIDINNPPNLRAFLPDGKVIGFSWVPRTIYRWDFKSGKEIRSILEVTKSN